MPLRPENTAVHKARWEHRSLRTLRVGLAIILAALNVLPASAGASEPATLDVLFQDRVGVTGPHLAGALATATRLFRSAGVRLRWRQSPPTGPENPPHFTIVLTSQFDTPLKVLLGPSNVGLFLRGARRAYVMYDQVVVMGRRYPADAATMLGWALAHEVGHLLLGDAHAASGVMSAQLTPDRFLEDPFSAAERASMNDNASPLRMPPPPRLAGIPEMPVFNQSSTVDRTH